mmetsp:Transcript_142439/g.248457  ORF Transcript_142439/g.248457 Transcript_142439/m.248457 type:complete len:255 (+) Transcript_142439:639-1403(+)
MQGARSSGTSASCRSARTGSCRADCTRPARCWPLISRRSSPRAWRPLPPSSSHRRRRCPSRGTRARGATSSWSTWTTSRAACTSGSSTVDGGRMWGWRPRLPSGAAPSPLWMQMSPINTGSPPLPSLSPRPLALRTLAVGLTALWKRCGACPPSMTRRGWCRCSTRPHQQTGRPCPTLWCIRRGWSWMGPAPPSCMPTVGLRSALSRPTVRLSALLGWRPGAASCSPTSAGGASSAPPGIRLPSGRTAKRPTMT